MRKSSYLLLLDFAILGLLIPGVVLSGSAYCASLAAPVWDASGRSLSKSCAWGFSGLDAAEQANVDTNVFPGAVYVISANSKVVHKAAVGVMKVGGRPIRMDAIFRLASMSKPITAAAIMVLVDDGRVHLNDPISHYVADFGKVKVGRYVAGEAKDLLDPARAVTIRDLLTLTSGMESESSVPEAVGATMSQRTTLAASMPYYAGFPLAWEPGSAFRYGGMAFDVLGRIVETASGESFDRFLSKRIFKPLGMRDTTFRLTQAQAKRLVSLYQADAGSFAPASNPNQPDTYFSGSAGLFGTAGDYLTFAQMLAGRGELNGVRILSVAAVDQMSSLQLQPTFPGLGGWTGWGFGMRVVTNDSVLPAGSYGWSGAFGTHFWIDPSRHLVAVLMINLAKAGGARAPTAREFERIVMRVIGTCPPVR